MCTTARERSCRSREARGGIYHIDVFKYRHCVFRPQQMEAALREEMISFLKALPPSRPDTCQPQSPRMSADSTPVKAAPRGQRNLCVSRPGSKLA